MGKLSLTLMSSLFSATLSIFGLTTLNKELKKIQIFSEELQAHENNVANHMPAISIIIPARNEQEHIVDCLESIFAQSYPDFEVIAVDDNSTDNTPQLLQGLKKQLGNKLTVVNATPPKPGWLGKNNALWQGYAAIRSETEWVLFIDADVKLTKVQTLIATLSYVQSQKLDLLSLLPSFRLNNFWTKVITPEITKLYGVVGSNPFKPPKPGSVEEALAVGAFILVKREAYQKVEGHRALRNVVLEDIELARTFRRNGFTTFGFPAPDYLEWEQYENLPDLWESVTKNLYFVGGKSWGNVIFVVGIELVYGLLPFISLGKLALREKKKTPSLLVLSSNILALGLLLGVYAKICLYLKVPLKFILLYPVSVFLSSILLLHSAIKASLGKAVTWKGRKIEVR